MALCLSCGTTDPRPGRCPYCQIPTIDEHALVTATVPVGALELLGGLAERMVGLIDDPTLRRVAGDALTRAVDLIERSAQCGPITASGMMAADVDLEVLA